MQRAIPQMTPNHMGKHQKHLSFSFCWSAMSKLCEIVQRTPVPWQNWMGLVKTVRSPAHRNYASRTHRTCVKTPETLQHNIMNNMVV